MTYFGNNLRLWMNLLSFEQGHCKCNVWPCWNRQNWVFRPYLCKDVLDLLLRKKKKLTFDLYFFLKMSCQQDFVGLHWRKRNNEHAYKIMLLTVFFITHKRVKKWFFHYTQTSKKWYFVTKIVLTYCEKKLF